MLFPFSLFVTGKKNRRLSWSCHPPNLLLLSAHPQPLILILDHVGIVFGKC